MIKQTYDGGKYHHQNRDNDSSHAEQEAYQPHAGPMAPWQPKTRPEGGDHLDHKNDDGLCSSTFLPATDRETERDVGCEQQAREKL